MVARTLVLLGILAALAWAPAASAMPLGGWEYHHDSADGGLAAGWQHGGPAEGWSPVALPHVLDATPLESNFGGSVGWYRVRFDRPGPGEWAARFEQARRRARVWLNGVEVGANADPYAAFEAPLDGLRDTGNVLVVRVDSRRSRTVREGWWNWGGLIRPVSLVRRGPLAIHDLGLMPRLRCTPECRGSVLVEGVAVNRSRSAEQAFMELTLTSPSGVVTRHSLNGPAVRPGSRRPFRATLAVSGDPEVWTPDSPALYDAVLRVAVGGEVVQEERARLGIRRISVRRGLLRLNGRVLQLRGASIQEDTLGSGAALSDADVERIVAALKALGANVTRAHYALDERLLRRFDEEGILVWNQAPVYHADRDLVTPAGRTVALARVRAAVLATRSHPSVITHSVANELAAKADERPGTRTFLARAAALTRRLDPTRPVALDILTYPGIDRQEIYDRFDLLGVNNYFGWYSGKPEHSTRRFGDLEPYLRVTRRRYRRQAMVMTEFGVEALLDGPRTLRGSFAFQADYLNRTLDVVERNRFVGGAIYWTLSEFAVKPRWDGGLGIESAAVDSIHNKGLIGYDGTPKPAFFVAQQRFARTPLYRR